LPDQLSVLPPVQVPPQAQALPPLAALLPPTAPLL